MRKSACILLAAIFAAGALALFAGCGRREVGEAEKAEVLSALDRIEVSAFEASVDATIVEKKTTSGVVDGKTKWSDKEKSTATQTVDLTAFERDGSVFADSFSNFVDKDGTKRFAVAFFRGQRSFVADGEWEEVGVKAGNFDALVEECRERFLLVPGEDAHLAVEMEDVQDFGDFCLSADSKVFRTGRGYRIEYDVIDMLQTIFEKLGDGAEYYAEHPDCTLGELFAAAGLEGLDAVFAYAVETLGGTPSVQEIFGDPYSFGAAVREAKEDPEAFLIETLFGFIVAGSNEGAIDFTVSVDLDKQYALRKIENALNVSMSERSYWAHGYGDYDLTVLETEIEVKMKAKPLAEEPHLTNLAWLFL